MKSRTIALQSEIEQVIGSTEVCHVSMVDLDGKPYVLPFNFGFHDGSLYLHSGPEGKKIEIWKQNPNVCVAFSSDYLLRYQHKEVACSYSMKYRSVLIYGKVEEICDMDEKKHYMNIIMKKYTGRDNFDYSLPALKNVKVFRVKPEKIEGKAYGY
jgi:nitroimidazol reductase NimA-like FMN-containing flavoprotein (pyridoxamine 5'-phosphate oxidase superfamily)